MRVLLNSSDDNAEKAESQGKLSFISKSKGLRRAAKEKKSGDFGETVNRQTEGRFLIGLALILDRPIVVFTLYCVVYCSFIFALFSLEFLSHLSSLNGTYNANLKGSFTSGCH